MNGLVVLLGIAWLDPSHNFRGRIVPALVVLPIFLLGGYLTAVWQWRDFEKKYPEDRLQVSPSIRFSTKPRVIVLMAIASSTSHGTQTVRDLLSAPCPRSPTAAVPLRVQRQAAAVRMFQGFFRLSILALEVGERHVQRLVTEADSQGFMAEHLTLTSALPDHARTGITCDRTGICRYPSRSCLWMLSNRVPSNSLRRLPAQSPILIMFSSCSHLGTFQES